MAFHALAPDLWRPEMYGVAGYEQTAETCVIRGQGFFIRGLVRVPIVAHREFFEWGVWVSLSEDNFRRALDLWDVAGREATPAMFGWLSTELPTYGESTMNLRTMVHTQPMGTRPYVEIEPTEHPLAVEQRVGVSWDAMMKRVEQLSLHG